MLERHELGAMPVRNESSSVRACDADRTLLLGVHKPAHW